MHAMKRLTLGLAALTLCGAEALEPISNAQAQTAKPPFASVKQAVDAFATNSPAVRGKAYSYVEGAAKRAKVGFTLRTALSGLRSMAVASGDAMTYESFCLKEAASATNDLLQSEFYAAFAKTPLVGKEPARVATRLESVLEDRDRLSFKVRMEVAKALADIYANRMADVDRGVRLLEEFAAAAGTNLAQMASARVKQMDIYRQARMDRECEAVAQGLMDMEECPGSAFAAASSEMARIVAKKGNRAKAGDFLAEALERGCPVPVGFALQLIKVKADTNAVERAVAAMRGRIASVALNDRGAFQQSIERWQPEIIQLLNYIGRGDEALGECRVWVFFAPQTRYQSAVDLTARTFKNVDANLGRAVAFMNFQRKGIVPEGRNPMMDAPPLEDPVRRAAWERLSLSQRLLWLDDPYGSAEAAMKAFAAAPFNDASLQLCANALMRPILAATRNPAMGENTVSYLLYGERGRDGKPNTADDAVNPLEAVGNALKIGVSR